MLAHAYLPLLVFEHGFIRIRFGIFEVFCFCFMSNKYFLILSNFTRYLFSVNNFLLIRNIQKQSSRGVLWERCSWKFHKIHRKKTCARVTSLIKSLKNRLWDRCFPVNFVKFHTFSYRKPLVAASAHTKWMLDT